MGRQLKRVALDFKYPLNKVWEGYLNPYSKLIHECKECNGTGYTDEYNLLHSLWYLSLYRNEAIELAQRVTNKRLINFVNSFLSKRHLSKSFFSWAEHYGYDVQVLEKLRNKIFDNIDELMKKINSLYDKRNYNVINIASLVTEYSFVSWNDNIDEHDIKALIDADRLWDFTRIPINDEQKEICKNKIENGGNSWLPFNNGYIPTPDEVNAWNSNGFGHDSINAWTCIKNRLEMYGIKDYTCKKCHGTGYQKLPRKLKKKYKNWTEYEPQTGNGFQLWENTSEGSPVSPVFKSLESLCEWAENNATTFGSSKTTKEQWMQMFNEDFVRCEEGNMCFI